MTTEHTPGPWSRSYIYGAFRHIERNVDRDAFLDAEAAVTIDEGREMVPDCRYNPADVDLIAAAPELLAACEAAAEELRLLRAKDDVASYDPTVRARLDLAITKARGAK